jgi:hypothetical protein
MDPQAQVPSESNRALKRKSSCTTSTERYRPEKRTKRTDGLPTGSQMNKAPADMSAQFSLPTSKYSYQPLEDGHIRLLRINNSCSDERIALSVVHVSLNDAPKYEALSYC